MIKTAAILAALQLLTADAGANENDDNVENSSDDIGAGSSAPAPARSSDNGGDDRSDEKWIDRWAPERNMGEVGVYAGAFLPGRRLELFEPDPVVADQGFQRYANVATAIGGRVGYYPSRFFGIEGEGGVALAKTAADQSATFWNVRGTFIAQLGLWSVTPFLAAGAGALAVSSDSDVVGNDVDAAVHVGGGVKINMSRRSQIRLDLRDVISSARGVEGGENHNFEALLGIGLTLGREEREKPVQAAVTPEPEPADSDNDGVLDPLDACVNEWGDQPNGCPIGDRDNDGVKDDVDACVDEPGELDDGCPIRDSDGDGILDDDDACVNEPETKNAYKDKDGCPDEVPEKVKKFSGVIEGIYFDTGKATIKPKSVSKLDEVVEILREYPNVKLRIVGHTDDRGNYDSNMRLSMERAASVGAYLTDKGIDESRLETEGRGSDSPIEDNGTKVGRASNRRIEFKLVE